MRLALHTQAGKSIPVITVVLGVCAISLIIYLMPSDIFGCGNCKLGRETTALQTLVSIRIAQATFHEEHNRFGTLKELVAADLIDKRIVTDKAFYDYQYTESGVGPVTYCVHATRERRSIAYRDFNVTEEGVIRANTARRPALLLRNDGIPISESPIPE